MTGNINDPEDQPDFNLDSYDFNLPEKLIAQRPSEKRIGSRLMLIDRESGDITHHRFSELLGLLKTPVHFTVNNSKVIPARFLGKRVLNKEKNEIGGRVEVLLLAKKTEDGKKWRAIMNSSGRQVSGFELFVEGESGDKVHGKVIEGTEISNNGTVVIEFESNPLTHGMGMIPLPPYIRRANFADMRDTERYQTVYAKDEGSSAAPTAGLHFDEDFIQKIVAAGHHWSEVTLHVGLGTFRPVKTKDIREHQMHEEVYSISVETVNSINRLKADGVPLLAVGTTTVRTLEAAFGDSEKIQQSAGNADLFIYPGGRSIKAVNHMITNFHLPKSTLLMMVSSFAGKDLVMKAYEEAIREKYRFFSYGDAMLIL